MKNINNFNNYMISNDGKVYSKRSKKFLIQTIDKCGYPRVVLWDKGKGYCIKIHRLVAEHFISNIFEMSEVNHIDGNKLNSHYTNLEWCTRSENVKHSYDIGLRQPTHPMEHENYRRLYDRTE